MNALLGDKIDWADEGILQALKKSEIFATLCDFPTDVIQLPEIPRHGKVWLFKNLHGSAKLGVLMHVPIDESFAEHFKNNGVRFDTANALLENKVKIWPA